MSAVEFRGMAVHSPCGAEVVMVLPEVGDWAASSSSRWGAPVPVERVLGARGELVFHRCRDYVDWHRVDPDRRDVNTLEVPAGGWAGAFSGDHRTTHPALCR